MITKNTEQLNRKANQCRILTRTTTGIYRVKSPSGNIYTVDLGMGGTCTCQWGQKGGAGCSHEMAARKDWERRRGRKTSFQAGDAGTVARAQHKATKPVAVQGEGAVTLVLRERTDPVAELDAEIDALGQEWQALNRAICPQDANRGQWWADRRVDLARLRELLMEKQKEREQAVVARRRTA